MATPTLDTYVDCEQLHADDYDAGCVYAIEIFTRHDGVFVNTSSRLCLRIVFQYSKCGSPWQLLKIDLFRQPLRGLHL